MIVVTGATGVIGSEVAAQLAARGAVFRVFVRELGKAAQLPVSVERAVGDFSRPETLAAALRGCDRLFLLSPDIDHRQFARTVEVAHDSGVRHVVKLSSLEAASGLDGIARWHRAEEEQLRASGLAWTFVRPGNFSSNALNWAYTIRDHATVYAATGDAQSAPIDPRDIAAVVALALTEQGHEGHAYELTGPELMTTEEQVATLSRILGRTLHYVDVEPSAMGEQLRGHGMTEPMVAALIELWHAIRKDPHPALSELASKLLGRPAISFEQWAYDHAAAFA
jgi:uncharacterized protein YbjT (DUF2867 family)